MRRLLFCLACLATLAAIFYAEENWRGRRDWENYKREWEAKGEKFDWQVFVPPPVPDDQNFAMAPFFEGVRLEWSRAKGPLAPYDTNRIAHLYLSAYRVPYDRSNDYASLCN